MQLRFKFLQEVTASSGRKPPPLAKVPGCRGDAYIVRYADDFVCCHQAWCIIGISIRIKTSGSVFS